MTDELSYGVANHVATITLNRPKRKNAFTLPMVDAWAAALVRAQADRNVRVVVVIGAGDAFCSGVDLAELRAVEADPVSRKRLLTDHVHRVARAVLDLDKPYLAALNGSAVGAGLDMALMCDMRLAARSARFSEGYVKVGLVPGDGGAWLLPRLVGPAKALEMLLTGSFVDATEAHRIGMVNSVHDDAELPAAVARLVARLAAAPPLVVELTKRAVRQGATMDLRTSLDLISSHFAVVQGSTDYAEGLEAVRTGRDPAFVNR
jgi:enoyl-CoA hydratase/carnithine racemase